MTPCQKFSNMFLTDNTENYQNPLLLLFLSYSLYEMHTPMSQLPKDISVQNEKIRDSFPILKNKERHEG